VDRAASRATAQGWPVFGSLSELAASPDISK
jgi:hypothetical protein